eukprot:gene20475-biopygen19115
MIFVIFGRPAWPPQALGLAQRWTTGILSTRGVLSSVWRKRSLAGQRGRPRPQGWPRGGPQESSPQGGVLSSVWWKRSLRS